METLEKSKEKVRTAAGSGLTRSTFMGLQKKEVRVEKLVKPINIKWQSPRTGQDLNESSYSYSCL